MNAKNILEDVMKAFCLSTQNLDKVYKLSGIKAQLYNGKRNYYQLRKLILRAITDDKAKEIINNMPFPYIETARGEYIRERKFEFWVDDVLVPLPKKKGYRMESMHHQYSIKYV